MNALVSKSQLLKECRGIGLMNGVEFQAAVAAIDPALGRRFAFMSGDVLNPELREFATAHDVQLLAKPFDIATVGELVGSLLAAPAS